MGEWKIRFPCGLEISERCWDTGLMSLEEEASILRRIADGGCFIHGKKCGSKRR